MKYEVKYDGKELDNIKYLDTKGMSMLANEASNFYHGTFNDKGFIDYKLEPWIKSKKDRGSTLIESGALRNSIHIGYVNNFGFQIASNLPYSEIHNEGGTIEITDKMRKFFYVMWNKTGSEKWKGLFLFTQNRSNTHITIPKRQFIGESHVLSQKLIQFINKYINI